MCIDDSCAFVCRKGVAGLMRRLTKILLILLVIRAGVVTAWAKEPGDISINGPGIDEEIVIPPDGSPHRQMLERMFMRDTNAAIEAEPSGLERGYALSIVLIEEGDGLNELSIEYYPTTAGNGYLYFPHNAGPDYPAGWYYARNGVQAEFAAFLSSHGVTMVASNIDGASPVIDAIHGSATAASAAPSPWPAWLLVGTLIIGLATGGFLVVRRLWSATKLVVRDNATAMSSSELDQMAVERTIGNEQDA